ncbi:MAG: tetratricopeptide repeat protein [candidate division KSB1 bacterium]|nr:tetratricopeptide repeat protein [candidate division KSB1 bacterium]MDZ7275263.1 tetratricopeptide repeat protein [candidate division KSB1 bacterium]MDZ7287431.1 tetratricopeptide repeat protein [candidate division KSB1 bacterium]MDZ7299545.1 tetratricopeptide repeat protein [candidate division KSB1 bacterium]MDZ7309094.1 tetratricopeptide repeat protein [candidate division KSB1 bacterium]
MRRYLSLIVLLVSGMATAAWSQGKTAEAKALLGRGKTTEALALLRQAVTGNPRDLAAWELLGETHLQAGRPDSAIVVGQTVIDVDNKNPLGYILVAKGAVAQKDFALAFKTLKNGRKNTKNNAALLTQLGEVYLAADSIEQAVATYTLAKEADPQNSAAYEGLGDAYARMGSTGMGILQYEKSLEIDSLQAALHHKLAKAYYKERRYTEAARTYERLTSLDTTNQAALFELGKIYVAAKLPREAARVYKTHVRRFPQVEEAWPLYMEAMFQSRQYQESAEAAQHILQRDPKAINAMRVLAASQAELKKYPEAIAAYQRLSALDTLSVDDLKRLGRSYAETRQDSLAALTYEKVVVRDPSQWNLYSDIGALYMRLKKFDIAANMFEKEFVKDPDSPAMASTYINYANCKMALRQWNEARAGLRKALTLQPKYLRGRNSLGLCLSQVDSVEEARKQYEMVIATGDSAREKYRAELAEANRQLGFLNLLDKKYPAAENYLLASLKLDDNDYQTHLWLAQAYALQNKREDARREYNRVLKLSPGHKDALEGLKLLGQ